MRRLNRLRSVPSDIEEGSLRLGQELGSGGQGIVYRVDGQPGLVFKQYKVTGADERALKTLVDLPGQLQPSEREWLLARASWPLARVFGKGELRGFLMGEIPQQFFAANDAGSMKLRELQFLLYQRKPLWGQIVPPDGVSARARIKVASEFARLIALLHGQGLVLGDISMSNVLWAGPGGVLARVFLIDCDGIRKLGSRPVLAQAETLDWNDPLQPPSGPDLDTDRYKLALLVGRVLSQTPYSRPGAPLPFVPGVPDRVAMRLEALWRLAAGRHGTRPDAAQWVLALSNVAEGVTRGPAIVGRADPRSGADRST